MKKWGRILNDLAADPPARWRAGLHWLSPPACKPYGLEAGMESGWKADIFSFITV